MTPAGSERITGEAEGGRERETHRDRNRQRAGAGWRVGEGLPADVGDNLEGDALVTNGNGESLTRIKMAGRSGARARHGGAM